MIKNINNSVRYESRLASYRAKMGFTRKEMSEKLRQFGFDISDVTYEKWEDGYRCPSLHTCDDLRVFLNTQGIIVNDLVDIFPRKIH